MHRTRRATERDVATVPRSTHRGGLEYIRRTVSNGRKTLSKHTAVRNRSAASWSESIEIADFPRRSRSIKSSGVVYAKCARYAEINTLSLSRETQTLIVRPAHETRNKRYVQIVKFRPPVSCSVLVFVNITAITVSPCRHKPYVYVETRYGAPASCR